MKVLFPEAKTFSDIFADYARPGYGNFSVRTHPESVPFKETKIAPYCYRGLEESNLEVKAHEHVYLALFESMIPVENDRLFWKIVDRDDETSLVICSHNKIIGSRYVAVIDTKTIPSF